MASWSSQKLVYTALAASLGAAAAYKLLSRRSRTLRIVVFLDGPNGCSKTGFSVQHASGTGLQQLHSAVCSKAQLHKVTLYGLSSKQQLTECNLRQQLLAEAAACGGTAVLLAAVGEQQALSEAALQLPGLSPVPWAPGWLPLLGHRLALLSGPWGAPFSNLALNMFGGNAAAAAAASGPTMLLQIGPASVGQQLAAAGVVDQPEDGASIVFTADPAVVAELLARQDDFVKMWDRPQQLAVQRISDNGLFTSSTTSPDWQTARGLMSRGFNQLKLAGYFPLVMDKIRVFLGEWGRYPPGGVIRQVNEWLACMASDAVVVAASGWDMRNLERKGAGEDVHPFLSAFKFGLRYAFGIISAWEALGWRAALNPFASSRAAMEAKFAAARKVCDDMVEDMVERTRRGELGSGVSSTLSSLLAEKSPSNGQYVRQRAVYGHVINLMVAGHETTAATLGFLLYYLARHPQWEDAIRQEARAVLAGRAELSLSDLPRLVVAEACFKEALRLHPPVGMINRDAQAPAMLGGRWLLQRGQRVAVLLTALHRNEAHWGGRWGSPHDFNPERFMPGAAEASGRHPCAFMPFGMGVRMCIGQQFALLEAKAWIAATYDHFTFKLPEDFKFMPSHKEGGASPNLQGLEVQVFPAPGARTASAVARVPAFFSKASAAAAAAAAAGGGGSAGHRRSNSLSKLHTAAEATCPAVAAAYVPSLLSQEAAAYVSSAAAGGLQSADANGTASQAVSAVTEQKAAAAAAAADDDDQRHGTPLLVLYGSNAGTCESFADLLVEQAGRAGFAATAASLDSIITAARSSSRSRSSSTAGGLTAKLPQAGALVVITSTYNGYPPDNALQFARWLDAAAEAGQGAAAAAAAGLRYAVFGVGSSQWETFHAFPKRVDARLAAAGGQRLRGLAAADVCGCGFADAFEAWQADLLAELLAIHNVHVPREGSAAAAAAAAQSFASRRRIGLRLLPDAAPFAGTPLEEAVPKLRAVQGRGMGADGWPLDFMLSLLRVVSAQQLQAAGSGRFTRHVELQLPEGMTYTAGSHLLIQPVNSPHLVQAALQLLQLTGSEAAEWTPAVTQEAAARGCCVPPILISSRQALAYLADLAAVPTRRQVLELAELCGCPPEAAALWELAAEDNYREQVSLPRLTVLELLSRHRSLLCSFSLGSLVNFLPRLKPRYYSISSSPHTAPDRAAVTVARVEVVTPSGRLHRGPGSCTLHDTQVGGLVVGAVSQLQSSFRLPPDPSTPLIMVGPGTGVAPFMGFLEERQALQQAGAALGPAVLFFGCRHPQQDFLYRERLEGWRACGVLSSLAVAFSREGPCKVYVQDLIKQQGEQLWQLLDKQGAVVYVCGDARRMAPGVAAAFQAVAQEWGGRSSSTAASWLGSMREAKRYLEDVWA